VSYLDYPQITDYFQKNGKDYIKVFLINSSTTGHKDGTHWRVTSDSIAASLAKSKGRPFIVMPYETPDGHTVSLSRFRSASEEKQHLLDISWPNAAGYLVDTDGKPDDSGNYWGYFELTDKRVIDAFKNGYGPKFVSPEIIQNNLDEPKTAISDWELIHVAAVDIPAFGHVAKVKAHCNGEQSECLTRLRNAGISSVKEDCGFCVTSLLKSFKNHFHKAGSSDTSLNSEASKASRSLDKMSEQQEEKPREESKAEEKQQQPPQEVKSAVNPSSSSSSSPASQSQSMEQIIANLSEPVRNHIATIVKERDDLAKKYETEAFKINQLSEKYKQLNEQVEIFTKRDYRQQLENVLTLDAFDGDDKARKKMIDLAMDKGIKADDEFLRMLLPIKQEQQARARKAGITAENQEFKAKAYVPSSEDSPDVSAKVAAMDQKMMSRRSLFLA